MITAPQHAVSDSVYDAIRAAVIKLAPLARASTRTASSTSSTDAHPETPCDLQIPVVRRQGGPPVHTPCDVFR